MIKIIQRILGLAGEHKNKLYLAFFFSFLENVCANVPVIVILFTLNDITTGQFTMANMMNMLWIMVGALLLQYLFNLVVSHFQSGTGFKIIGEQRFKIGEQLRRAPMGYFSDKNVGNISAVVTSDLSFVELYSMQFISKIVNAVAGGIIIAVFVFFIDVQMALITLTAYPLAYLVYIKIQSLFKRFGQIRQEAQVDLISSVLEYVHGISVIKAFNMKGKGFKKFADSVKRFETSALEFEMIAVPWLTAYHLCFQIGAALILYFGPYFYFAGELVSGKFFMFMVIAFRMYLPIEIIGMSTGIIRLMGACLDRIDEIKSIPLLDEKDVDKPINGYDIEFKNVSFAYEQRDTIKNLSFKVKERTITALVGPSGSGKTTITNLISRFWDVQKGEISLGGTNIKDMKCDSIMSHISIVFQNVYLFNDTILNNIKFGNPLATMEEVINAAKKARCHGFIEKLDNGYETMIGEGGSTLSGGEKQRLSIARAILKDAPIIILDEATASIDPENEKKIQQAINSLVKNKTLIVIAHRLSTIRNADQILVLADGSLHERGTHDELLEKQGLYADFWQRRQKTRDWRLSNRERATASS
jgi:ATP-binding cassette subfamily B protein